MESWREELYLAHGFKKGEERSGHKYISREWKNGRWVYYYTLPNKNNNTKTKSNLITKISDLLGFDELERYKRQGEKVNEAAKDIADKKKNTSGKTENELATENRERLKNTSRQRNIVSDEKAKVFKRPMPDHLKPGTPVAPIHQPGSPKPSSLGTEYISDYSQQHKPTYNYSNTTNNYNKTVRDFLKAESDYFKTPLGKIDKTVTTFKRAGLLIDAIFKKLTNKKKG